jgi:biopolymer transport protein ExbD
MITRPLELSSRLSKPSSAYDWLYFVNLGLIVLFFSLFGSRFVIAPGIGTDFALPVQAQGQLEGARTTHVVSVRRGGLIFADPGGNLTLAQLKLWLKDAARELKEPRLLVRAAADVALGDLSEIRIAAEEAGFVGVVWAAEPGPSP